MFVDINICSQVSRLFQHRSISYNAVWECTNGSIAGCMAIVCMCRLNRSLVDSSVVLPLSCANVLMNAQYLPYVM